MKKLNTLIVALFVAGTAMAQTWTLDKSHGRLGFNITHLMVSDVDGVFTAYDIKLNSTKEDFSDAVIELTAETKSVNTSDEKRDGHLKSADFFDVEKFATLNFKSKSFTKVDGKKYKLAGDLTLHGVTKPVTLDVVVNGPTVHPFNKKPLAGFKVTGAIKRSDFGLGSQYPGAILGDEVIINASFEFTK
jgi:polyisoprenoid-binding protein YceI